MTRGSERTLRKSSVSKDFSGWQEWKGLPNGESEMPGAGGKEELVGAPEEAAFSYLVYQERAETPWRSEGQSVSISCFIRRPILITLPSQLGIGHLCLFLLQRLLALLPLEEGRGYLFKNKTLGIHHPCIHVTIRTWLLGYLSYNLNIFVPMMVNAQLIIRLTRRNKHTHDLATLEILCLSWYKFKAFT